MRLRTWWRNYRAEGRALVDRFVLQDIQAHPDGVYVYGDLHRRLPYRSGTLYPSLARLAEHGFIHGEFMYGPNLPGKQSRRRYYPTTPNPRAVVVKP